MTDVAEFLKAIKYLDVSKLWIIPLSKNSKRPLKGFKWKDGQRITLRTAVKALMCGYNVAFVAHTKGYAFLDVDNPKVLKELTVPETLAVRTPNGGFHFYFVNDLELSNNVYMPDYELRVNRTYVVAVGSSVNGKVYRIVYERKPAKLSKLLEVM